MKTLKVDRNMAEMRLDRYVSKVTTLSKGEIQKNIRKKNIKVNGKRAAASDRVSEGDAVSFFLPDSCFPEKKKGRTKRKRITLPVLFENENIIAVDKPSGMLSQSDGSDRPDVVTVLRNGGLENASVVTRLDMNTSGIVLAGKNRRSLMELNEMSRKGLMDKRYLALVKGRFTDEGSITLYGRKNSEENRLEISEKKAPGFSEITSVFSVRKRFSGYTLLEVTLLTGKTHQIRAMLEFLGHPVAGDRKYGNDRTRLKRQFLHCHRLVLDASGKYEDTAGDVPAVISPLPWELESFLGGLEDE